MSTLHRVDSPVSSDQYSTPIAPVQPDTSSAAETQTHLVLRLQPAAPSERTPDSQEVRGQALNPALAAALTPSSPRGGTVPLVAQDEGGVDGGGLNAPRRDIQDFDNPDPEPGLGSRLWDVLYPVGVAIYTNAPGAYAKISEGVSRAYAAAYPIGEYIVKETPGAVAKFSEVAYPLCVTMKTFAVLGFKTLYEGSKPLCQAFLDGWSQQLNASRTIDEGSGGRKTQHDGWVPNIVPWNDPYNVKARAENPNSPHRNGRPMQ